METIDCTPTWEGILPVMVEILEGRLRVGKEGKDNVKREITRMAQLADKYVALNNIQEDTLLEKLATVLEKAGLRHYLNVNGFGYSGIERDIVGLFMTLISPESEPVNTETHG